jgi:hypothetical protein
MNLSFKDIQFIIEAIDNLIEKYQERLKSIEDVDEDEDEASDLGNDCMFLTALKGDLAKSLEQSVSPQSLEYSGSSRQETKEQSFANSEGLSLPELMKPVLQLPINDRLVLVDAITESIRQELSVSKS